MAGITLAQAEEQLAAYLSASEAIGTRGQSYTMPDGRSLSRVNAAFILNQIEFWDAKCKELDPSHSPSLIRRAVPRV